MSDELEELQLVLVPPRKPAPASSWDDAQSVLGVRFSEPFRDLMETYGEGVIGAELWLFDPRRSDTYWSRESPRLSLLRNDFERPRERPPLPGYPADGPSLFTVAHNGNGDQIFLIVEEGLASDDTLWIGNRRNLKWLDVSGPLSTLLADVLTRGDRHQAIVRMFSPEVWTLPPTFTSVTLL
jgi:hypothetical protein